MNDELRRDLARDPQDLERLLVSRQRSGDLEGMVALYEPDAVLECDGRQVRGARAISAFYSEQLATGKKFEFGDQRPAMISGDLALTSTRLSGGDVTAEVARLQHDGSWLWVIDRFAV